MEIIKTNIPDLIILKPKIFKDTRGYFMESYKKEYIKSFYPVQDNESFSKFGVIRGLHFQMPPYDQAKLIRVLNGKIMDVAVDLRTSSPTYGKHESIILSSQNKKQLYVPKGFAHGFICLSKTAKILYSALRKAIAPISMARVIFVSFSASSLFSIPCVSGIDETFVQ